MSSHETPSRRESERERGETGLNTFGRKNLYFYIFLIEAISGMRRRPAADLSLREKIPWTTLKMLRSGGERTSQSC